MHHILRNAEKEREKSREAFRRLEQLAEHGFHGGAMHRRRRYVEDEDYE